MNFVDFVIILIILFYSIEGAGSGFIFSLLDLISFFISFAGGLSFYSFFGKFLAGNFSIPPGFANAIGFFLAAFFFEIISSLFLRNFLAGPINKLYPTALKPFNKILGAVLGSLSAILLLTFILTMIISLPLSSFVKHSVSQSKIASYLTSNTQSLSKTLNNIFGGAVNETITFLTVEPKGNESVNLNFKTSDFKIDYGAEKQMFDMVNKERTARGIRALSLGSQALIGVARAHCEDMFERGYFSHYTPEGLSPFDRMLNAGISFTAAGENLALAPNVDLAHKGLMESPGHRANILSPDFGRVGIGVIDGGPYGEMFCQEFTN